MIDYNSVVSQHWDDERIREAFIDDGGLSEYYDPIDGGKNNRRVMGAVFDAWLRSVKAKAWDEGYGLGIEVGHRGDDFWEKNPYRSNA